MRTASRQANRPPPQQATFQTTWSSNTDLATWHASTDKQSNGIVEYPPPQCPTAQFNIGTQCNRSNATHTLKYLIEGHNGLCYSMLFGSVKGQISRRAQGGHASLGDIMEEFIWTLCRLLAPSVEKIITTEPLTTQKQFNAEYASKQFKQAMWDYPARRTGRGATQREMWAWWQSRMTAHPTNGSGKIIFFNNKINMQSGLRRTACCRLRQTP